MVIANASHEFLRDLISLSYKLDQMIDESVGHERETLRAIRDYCDDSLARLLGLDDGPIVARPTLVDPTIDPSQN